MGIYIHIYMWINFLFYLNNDEAAEAAEAGICSGQYRESSGLQASTLTSGTALSCLLGSVHSIVWYFQTQFLSPFGSWEISKTLLTEMSCRK